MFIIQKKMREITLKSRFKELGSEDGRLAITDRGKKFLFQEFLKTHPNLYLNFMIELDNLDIFQWWQYELENLRLKYVLLTMQEIIRDFLLTQGYSDENVNFLLERR